LGVGYTFGGLTVTGNIFTVNDSADWFNWFVVKPYGTGHSLQGLNITGNTFRSINGSITRVERVDTTFADLDYWSFRNIVIDGNTFNAVVEQFQNPVTVDHTQASNAQNWAVSFSPYLPFKAYARRVSAVIADGKITSGTSTGLYTMPYTTRNTGANFDQVRLTWSTACKGKVRVTARIDNPI